MGYRSLVIDIGDIFTLATFHMSPKPTNIPGHHCHIRAEPVCAPLLGHPLRGQPMAGGCGVRAVHQPMGGGGCGEERVWIV